MMKSTGIVRRIDDLGRIVIPKEIRNNFKIHANDSLEIYVEDDSIKLKKFSILTDKKNIYINFLSIISYYINRTILYFDLDNMFIFNNNDYTYYNNISDDLKKVFSERKHSFFYESSIIRINDDISLKLSYVGKPVISNGDMICYIIIGSDGDICGKKEEIYLNMINDFFLKNIEE